MCVWAGGGGIIKQNLHSFRLHVHVSAPLNAHARTHARTHAHTGGGCGGGVLLDKTCTAFVCMYT